MITLSLSFPSPNMRPSEWRRGVKLVSAGKQESRGEGWRGRASLEVIPVIPQHLRPGESIALQKRQKQGWGFPPFVKLFIRKEVPRRFEILCEISAPSLRPAALGCN